MRTRPTSEVFAENLQKKMYSPQVGKMSTKCWMNRIGGHSGEVLSSVCASMKMGNLLK